MEKEKNGEFCRTKLGDKTVLGGRGRRRGKDEGGLFCLSVFLPAMADDHRWFSESDRTSRMEPRGNPEGRVPSSPASSMAFHFLTSEEGSPDRHGGFGSCLSHCRRRGRAGSTGVQWAKHHQRTQEETAEANRARRSDRFSESPSTVRSASCSRPVAT